MINIMLAIETAGESNREFLEDLYTHYNRLMFSTAHQYHADWNTCEDVVQDAVLQLCKKVDLLKGLPPYALPAYINYTTKNMAINHLRHQAVVDRHIQSFPDEEAEAQNCDPRDVMSLTDLKNDLKDVWSQLSEQDQELLYRRYVFGEETAELAEIFHCKAETIRVRLSRARKRAADLMKEANIYDEA